MSSTIAILRAARATGDTIAAVDHLLQIGYDVDRAMMAARPYVHVRIVVARATAFTARAKKRRTDDPSSSRWRDIAMRAARSGEWVYDVGHGGTVANAYRYHVLTECVVAVASPDGVVVLWYGSVSANKATARGAAVDCVGVVAASAFDGRCGVARRDAGRAELRDLHAAER